MRHPGEDGPQPDPEDGPERDEERMRNRIAHWLEEALAHEDLPAEVPPDLADEVLDGREPDAGADLYGLQAAVTALATEVKLQGRAFDRVGRGLGDLERLTRAVESMQQPQADGRGDAEPAEQVLMDVRDRLDRGAQAARKCPERAGAHGRLRAITGGAVADLTEAVEALETGYQMASTRVDHALASYGIRAIACEGETFDPERMTVVDVQHDARQREGTVLEVVRPGYERDEETIRFAEVRVAGGGARDGGPAGMLDRVVRKLKRTLGQGE